MIQPPKKTTIPMAAIMINAIVAVERARPTGEERPPKRNEAAAIANPVVKKNKDLIENLGSRLLRSIGC